MTKTRYLFRNPNNYVPLMGNNRVTRFSMVVNLNGTMSFFDRDSGSSCTLEGIRLQLPRLPEDERGYLTKFLEEHLTTASLERYWAEWLLKRKHQKMRSHGRNMTSKMAREILANTSLD